MSSKEIGVGVIGLGYWGPNLARNFHECSGTKLAAFADADQSRLDQLSNRYPSPSTYQSGEDLIADGKVDAVAIATPVGTHFKLAEAALNAGKHVLVEKPLTATVEEAEKLCALAEKQDRLLMVDHTFLYTNVVRRLKEIIDSEKLGTLLYLDSARINLGKFQSDVNVVWDLAPHDLSIWYYFMGREPKTLRAVGRAHAGANHADQAHLLLDYGDNVVAHLHVSWLSPVKVRQMMIGGTKQTVIYDDNNPLEKIRIYDSGIEINRSPDAIHNALVQYRLGDMTAPHVPAGEALSELARHFAACINKEETPVSDGTAGKAVVKLLTAADKSLAGDGELVAIE